MHNDKALMRQVQHNCTISDARFAGIYSVCGLAMRLRDLYKWEHGLPPYEEHDAHKVLEWIGRKETRWEALQEAEYRDLVVDGQAIDPFDTIQINRLIQGRNLFYGAGYAQSLKPSFLLAEIEEQTSVAGYPVLYLGPEKARDLLTLPAFTQDDVIIVRKAAIEFYIWDQMLYLNQSGRPFFQFGLAACGLSEKDAGGLRNCLPKVVGVQEATFLYHEVGEMADTHFEHAIWRSIIATLPHTPAEFLARAVKDILADTHPQGTLPQIIHTHGKAALGFYAGFLDGLRKELFPEIRAAISDFMRDGNWQNVEAMTRAVHRKAQTIAQTITTLFVEGHREQDYTRMEEELVRRYLCPPTGRQLAPKFT